VKLNDVDVHGVWPSALWADAISSSRHATRCPRRARCIPLGEGASRRRLVRSADDPAEAERGADCPAVNFAR